MYMTDWVETLKETSWRTFSLAGFFTFFFLSPIFFELLSYPWLSETYPDWVAGYSAYNNLAIENRVGTISLYMALSVIVFFGFLIYFQFLTKRRSLEFAIRISTFCLLPFFVWMSGILFRPPHEVQFGWWTYSAFLLTAAMVSFISPLSDVRVRWGIIHLALVPFASHGLSVALRALNLHYGDGAIDLSQLLSFRAGMALLFLALVSGALFLGRKADQLKSWIQVVLSGCVLLLFSLLIPLPYLLDGQLTSTFPIWPTIVLAVVFISVGLMDVVRRVFWQGSAGISPFVFLALLVLLQSQNNLIPTYTGFPNFFEYGIRLPASWAVLQGELTLFKDIQTTYGIWDHLPFWFSHWLDPTGIELSNFVYGEFLRDALVLMVSYFTVSWVLGPFWAFSLFVIMHDHSLAFLFFAMISLFVSPVLLNRPLLWLSLLVGLGSVYPFLRVPQGITVLACLVPLALWQMSCLFQGSRRHFYFFLAGFGIYGVGLLAFQYHDLAIPFVRTVLEYSSVNEIWAGNAWGFESRRSRFLSLLTVISGNLIVFVPVLASALALALVFGEVRDRYRRAFTMVSVFGLLSFLMVTYGYSRMDMQPVSRQEVALSLFMPLLLFLLPLYFERTKALIYSALVCCLLFRLPPPSASQVLAAGLNLTQVKSSEFFEGADKGLNGVGYLRVNASSRKRLLEKAKVVELLDRHLPPGEPYFDLTTEGINYFLARRMVFSEFPSFYVYPTSESQLRTLRTLCGREIFDSLLNKRTIDSPFSLRAYYFFRYALLNGVPWDATDYELLLLNPERVEKMPTFKTMIERLDATFSHYELGFVPVAWGASWSHLESLFVDPQSLSLSALSPNHFELNLPASIDGLNFGLIRGRLETASEKPFRARVSWIAENLKETSTVHFWARQGELVIPVDASHRWLLAQGIKKIRLLVHGAPEDLKVSGFQLGQRSVLDQDLQCLSGRPTWEALLPTPKRP